MIRIPIELNVQERQAKFELELHPERRRHDQWMARLYRENRCYESEMVWTMFRALRSGDVAIDIGANIGFFTLLMSRLVGETGQVIAVEPEDSNRELLTRHIGLNQATNVRVISEPLWSSYDEVTFYVNSDDESSSTTNWDPGLWFENERSRNNPRMVEKKTAMLDGLEFDRSRVRLLKLDTEGVEYHILRGAKSLLDHRPPFILLELNPFGMGQLGHSTEDLRDFLRGWGYALFFIHRDGQLPTFVPETVTVKYVDNLQVKNVLFSTIEAVAEIWPEASE